MENWETVMENSWGKYFQTLWEPCMALQVMYFAISPYGDNSTGE